MKIGDRVKYIRDNSFDNNSHMVLYGNAGIVKRVAKKYGEWKYMYTCSKTGVNVYRWKRFIKKLYPDGHEKIFYLARVKRRDKK